MNRTVIRLSKWKLLMLLSFAALFVAAGAWMFNLDAAEIESARRMRSPLMVHGIGALGMVFGALGCVGILSKLFDSAPGLVLDERGLTDNSSLFSAGFLPWSDIDGFDVYQVQKQRMVVVLLRDPDAYVARLGTLRRWMARANRSMAPSPVMLAANGLAIRFDDLLTQLHQQFEIHGRAQG